MKRTKQILLTVMGIIFIVLLFLFAMYLPRYLNAFFDKKMLDNVTQRNLNLKTYEISYNSFYEKLHAIAHCKKEELHVVAVQETGAKQEKEKITKIIQRELVLLAQGSVGMLHDITLKPSNLVSCETFTLYSSGDTERLKGITFWKILYQQKKEKFLFYLDEEYHKIYALEVTRKESSISGYDSKNGGLISSTDTDLESMGYPINDVPDPYTLWDFSILYLDYLIQYYDLQRENFYLYDEYEETTKGDFSFQDNSLLELGCQWERKVRKKNNYITILLGIDLDQMLQL